MIMRLHQFSKSSVSWRISVDGRPRVEIKSLFKYLWPSVDGDYYFNLKQN